MRPLGVALPAARGVVGLDLEPGLELNISALCEFDHQNYEVFFVLASESDPAASIVKRVASQARAKAHVVFAGAPQDCSEKINNLRAVIQQLPEEFRIPRRPVQRLRKRPFQIIDWFHDCRSLYRLSARAARAAAWIRPKSRREIHGVI